MAEDVAAFTTQVLEHWGALVEAKGSVIEALLPEEVATRLQVREEVRFRFAVADGNGTEEATEAQLVTYGSPVLEKILAGLATQGKGAAVALQGLYLKQVAPGPEVEQMFQPLNARGKCVGVETTVVPYGIFNFRYTAVSDEKTEGIVAVAVNSRSLAEVASVAHRWREAEWHERSVLEVLSTIPHPVLLLYRRASGVAQRQISRVLRDFHQSRERRLERDVQRLDEYYLGIAKEIRGRLHKKGLVGEEAEREEVKASAAERELGLKIHDLQDKYAVRVRVAYISVLWVLLPVLQATMSYQRRQAFREFPVFWNPLLKEWEAVACEGCGENTFAVSLCDDKQHLSCAMCSQPCPTCGRRFCRGCQPRGCPTCRKGPV